MSVDYREAVRDHRIDLLYQESELAGLIEFVLEKDHLLIMNVAVEVTCQGRGLGRRLMAHAEQVAKSEERRMLKLYTNKLMVENVRFYSKLGYRIENEVAFSGGFRINMSKLVELRGDENHQEPA